MGVDPAFISSFEADQFGAYDETQNNSNNESPFNKQMSGMSQYNYFEIQNLDIVTIYCFCLYHRTCIY